MSYDNGRVEGLIFTRGKDYILSPRGGVYSNRTEATSSYARTGFLNIKFPSTQNTTLSFWVDGSCRATQKSFSMFLSVKVATPMVIVTASTIGYDMPVRVGRWVDGRCGVQIGTSGGTWVEYGAAVRNVHFTYEAPDDTWGGKWDMFVDSINMSTVDETRTTTIVGGGGSTTSSFELPLSYQQYMSASSTLALPFWMAHIVVPSTGYAGVSVNEYRAKNYYGYTSVTGYAVCRTRIALSKPSGLSSLSTEAVIVVASANNVNRNGVAMTDGVFRAVDIIDDNNWIFEITIRVPDDYATYNSYQSSFVWCYFKNKDRIQNI